MTITGIIAEYNPFHNGHLLQLNTVKDNTSDLCIIAMSGNWVQRGAPAIINKYERTRMALLAGADLVLELPVHISTGSARDFAYGSVSLLNSLGCVDRLCFGCESNDSETIHKLVNFFSKEPADFAELLKSNLKIGLSYPKARYEAMKQMNYFNESELKFISSPNNLLGLEYAIAINMIASDISIFPIKREGCEYNDINLSTHSYSSASSIREALINSNIEQCLNHVPPFAYNLLKEAPLKTENSYSDALKYKLLVEDDFTIYLDVSRELSDRINKYKLDFKDTVSFIQLLKTKNLTYSHISRCLCHIMLNIYNDQIKETQYIRILGFRKESKELLGLIKSKASIPIITRPVSAQKQLDETAYKQFITDIKASQIYDSHNEFSTPLIII